ncbi:ArsR family transcriptional regulator [Streptomyces sp. 8K308]|uniref:ArsR/SmtB family transcription factor n=1 Tax=Streptomyces sp. 8K308 TaxID=2530388 RepID=UPI001049A2E6|nr:winged helix-turn-helix domain-containing protein [Streptomyces sp. 8K308]TDC08695.1 ArsR family transcriptional regulator [Streptomyces sp. 8K308]
MGEQAATGRPSRQEATVREAKALAHPLRARILRLCGQREMTNKQLADRLGRDPGTVLYHVRQLTAAGFLEPAPVRTGDSGALEKPYRSTGRSWWLNGGLANADSEDATLIPLQALQEELHEAGPRSIAELARFMLHLSPDELAEFNARVLAILDEYVATDDERRADRPAYGGLFILHRLAD